MGKPQAVAKQSPFSWPVGRWALFYGDRVLPWVIALVPPMAFAVPRALAALLPLAGILALPILLRRDVPRWFAGLILIGGRDLTLLIAVGLGSLWALVSCLWSLSSLGALGLWGRLAGLGLSGLLLLAAIDRLDPNRRRRLGTALIVGLVVGIVVGHGIWLYLRMPDLRDVLPLPYRFLYELNRGEAVMTALLWPAAYLLWRRGQWGLMALILAGAFHLLVRLDSATVRLSALAALGALMAAAALPRIVPSLLAGIAATAALLLPWIFAQVLDAGQIIQQFPQLVPSAQHRLYIWQFAVERIGEHPWLGWGLDASRAVPGGTLRPPVGFDYMPLHPHNSLLQVRLELGLVGAAVSAVLIGRGLVLAGRQPDRARVAIHVAMLGTYLMVGLSGYGVWQSWWIAAGWLIWAVGQTVLTPESDGKS